MVAAGRASGIKMREIDGGGLLISLDEVAPTRTVSVSASCYPPLHHKVKKKLSSGNGSPGWSGKKGRKTVVVVVVKTCGRCLLGETIIVAFSVYSDSKFLV